MVELSAREVVVAVAVAKGFRDYEIASDLSISRRRVAAIIQEVKRKWKIDSRVEIGVLAYHLELYKLEFVDFKSTVEVM